MLSDIKISIVVPVYNEEKYLERSINSLRYQSYSNIEIILVNDGSTDKSPEILNQYKKLDHRIIVFNKSNGGLVDATISGIRLASGEYTCFLDPDDYVGNDFILNFVKLIIKYGKLDFFATGFYQDNNGDHYPYSLKKNQLFNSDAIQLLKNNFLYDNKNLVSNSIFISRWNKIYKTNITKRILTVFTEFKNVSLGEDTIFTFIMLNICKNGLATTLINSYYYNIGNSNSMMKNTGISDHLKKAYIAFIEFKRLLIINNIKDTQAYILYYDLISSLCTRVKKNNLLGKNLYAKLKKDKVYLKAVNIVLKGQVSRKLKIKLEIFKKCNKYASFSTILNMSCLNYKNIKKILKNIYSFIINIRKYGLLKGSQKYKFFCQRNRAFSDIYKYLPILDKRIKPIIEKYIGKSTDLSKTYIEKNIFIFWWDGIEKAPNIVKYCIKSVQKSYPDYKIILITKNNFEKYSHINKYIIKNFQKGKISIQTFSDILRFNLLYYNGGVWTDATIFYRKKYDLIKGLKDKSFESICFNTSKKFLRYKNKLCSWSGFLIASRKYGFFVKVMNEIFEKYYLKYHTYSIYFFIDAAFMIAKLYKIDDGVLDKIQKSNESMFDLIKILNLKYYKEEFRDNTRIPQKLSWFVKIDKTKKYKTNYDHLNAILF